MKSVGGVEIHRPAARRLPRTGGGRDGCGPGKFCFFFWPLLTEVRCLTVHDWTQKTTVLSDLSAHRGGGGGGGGAHKTTDIKARAHLKYVASSVRVLLEA